MSLFPYFTEKHLFNPAKKEVIIDDITYPVLVDGAGDINFLSVAGATLLQRTFSSNFKKLGKFYSTDLYWTEDYELKDISDITMNKIVDDIFKVAEQLKLEKYILIGHSAYGIVALEAAKRGKPDLKGVIMIGTPVACNAQIIEIAQKHFEDTASSGRKVNDKIRKQYYATIKKPNESEISFNAYEAQSARYWGDYNVKHDFLKRLWKGVAPSNDISNLFFSELLPKHHTAINMHNVNVPVLLAGGKMDYDCIPLLCWPEFLQPKKFKIVDCGDVGHWPQYESSEIFDREIKLWLKENFAE